MARNIIYVGVTGGPCAGKTTLMDALNEYASEINESGKCERYPDLADWKIYVVPEAAERIINYHHSVGGDALPEKNWPLFQDVLIKTQLDDIEKIYRDIENEDCNVIIFGDRSLHDNLGYIENYGNFHPDVVSELRYKCLNAIRKVPKHDLVLYLKTVSESLYKNTACRTEDYAKALELSENIKTGYESIGSPVVTIPVYDTFEERMDDIIRNKLIPLVNGAGCD